MFNNSIEVTDKSIADILFSKLKGILSKSWTSHGYHYDWRLKYSVDSDTELSDDLDEGNLGVGDTSSWLSNILKKETLLLITQDFKFKEKGDDIEIVTESPFVVYINSNYSVEDIVKILDAYNPQIPQRVYDDPKGFDELIANSPDPFLKAIEIAENDRLSRIFFPRRCERYPGMHQ